MNWIELDKKNLPPDILVGDYEFQYNIEGKWYYASAIDVMEWLCEGLVVKYCKPEPEVIIKKSGGTWVARYQGEDYILTKLSRFKGVASDLIEATFKKQIGDPYDWQLFDEIEITDEIAKLRPIVVLTTGINHKSILYGVQKMYEAGDHAITLPIDSTCQKCTKIKYFRLATIEDL